MSLIIDYTASIDFVNPSYNTEFKSPLIQGTDVELYVTPKENGVATSIDDISYFTAKVVSYNKLDSNYTIIDIPLTITAGYKDDNTEHETIDFLVIKGLPITANTGLCAIALKYDDASTIAFAYPLLYYVKESPTYIAPTN